MKRLFTILLILLPPVISFSQAKQINAIFDRYESREDVTSIQLNSTLIGSFLSSLVDDETKDLVSKINAIRILNIGKSKGSETVQLLRRELNRIVDNGTMECIMNMKESGENVMSIFVSKDSREVLLFIGSGTEDFTAISMFGAIDKKVIDAVISGKISIKK
jgi:hypothetical protein